MAFIKVVPPRRAEGETASAYRYMSKVSGHHMVANVVQLFSVRPASMQRFLRLWELTMWAGSEPRATRELVAAAVSRVNHCHY